VSGQRLAGWLRTPPIKALVVMAESAPKFHNDWIGTNVIVTAVLHVIGINA
jgi:hypothetical protein